MCWNDRYLLRNCDARVGVVACDHDDPDARGMAILHSLLDARLGRILDAEESDEHHVAKEVLLREVRRGAVPMEVGWVIGPPFRDAQDSFGLAHERLGICSDDLLHLRCHELDGGLATLPHVGILAELRHAFRSTLQGEQLATLVVRLRDEHVLVGGVKRNLVQRRVVHDILDLFHAPRFQASLHHGNLGRGTDELVVLADHGGIIANPTTQHLGRQSVLVRWVGLAEVRHGFHRRRRGEVYHVAEGHVAPGESARLVRAHN
mmetsp:Transcript_6031/g.19027  ORF Transcript_6031/g.19027 Transcript_6031/m.19027 type:complete len:262 (+) Transcript_6031:1671-2456(+)